MKLNSCESTGETFPVLAVSHSLRRQCSKRIKSDRAKFRAPVPSLWLRRRCVARSSRRRSSSMLFNCLLDVLCAICCRIGRHGTPLLAAQFFVVFRSAINRLETNWRRRPYISCPQALTHSTCVVCGPVKSSARPRRERKTKPISSGQDTTSSWPGRGELRWFIY